MSATEHHPQFTPWERSKPTSQLNDMPWNTTHWVLASCGITTMVLCMCNQEHTNNYQTSILQVQSWPAHSHMFCNLPYRNKHLNQTSITMWSRNHINKCKCCTFDYNNILLYFRNLLNFSEKTISLLLTNNSIISDDAFSLMYFLLEQFITNSSKDMHTSSTVPFTI
jgi:hypothetical protein